MKAHITSRNAVFFAAGGLITALFLDGAAHAITDTVFKYSAAKTGYVTIPAAAFEVLNTSMQYQTSNGGQYFLNSDSCFMAPVYNLPQGAKLSALAYWYRRNGGNGSTLALYRTKVSDPNTGDTIAYSTDPADTANVYKSVNVNIANASVNTVDNRVYFYRFYLCLDPEMTFYGVRLTFTYTNAGD